MTPLVLAGCLALLASAAPVRAQDGLRLHLAVTRDAPGDTTGLRPLLDPTGARVLVGQAVLDLPRSSIETVGLEEDADGSTAVSVWVNDVSALLLSRVTTASTGRALAVLHDGRVVAVPQIEGAVTNGLVQITGLPAAEAERLAEALGGEPFDQGAGATPPRTLPRVPVEPVGPPARVAEAQEAGPAALAFVDALRRRRWVEAADALHPDAQAAVRLDALALLRVDGARIRVRDGLQEATFPATDVLSGGVGSLDGLGARDLAALYLAGLDAIGVWGPPGAPLRVVGEVADGAEAHVVLRREAPAEGGISTVTVVTVRRDAAGRWRALLTEARGY